MTRKTSYLALIARRFIMISQILRYYTPKYYRNFVLKSLHKFDDGEYICSPVLVDLVIIVLVVVNKTIIAS